MPLRGQDGGAAQGGATNSVLKARRCDREHFERSLLARRYVQPYLKEKQLLNGSRGMSFQTPQCYRDDQERAKQDAEALAAEYRGGHGAGGTNA